MPRFQYAQRRIYQGFSTAIHVARTDRAAQRTASTRHDAVCSAHLVWLCHHVSQLPQPATHRDHTHSSETASVEQLSRKKVLCNCQSSSLPHFTVSPPPTIATPSVVPNSFPPFVPPPTYLLEPNTWFSSATDPNFSDTFPECHRRRVSTGRGVGDSVADRHRR
eukprot:1254445-Rhodomonas_salina.2